LAWRTARPAHRCCAAAPDREARSATSLGDDRCGVECICTMPSGRCNLVGYFRSSYRWGCYSYIHELTDEAAVRAAGRRPFGRSRGSCSARMVVPPRPSPTRVVGVPARSVLPPRDRPRRSCGRSHPTRPTPRAPPVRPLPSACVTLCHPVPRPALLATTVAATQVIMAAVVPVQTAVSLVYLQAPTRGALIVCSAAACADVHPAAPSVCVCAASGLTVHDRTVAAGLLAAPTVAAAASEAAAMAAIAAAAAAAAAAAVVAVAAVVVQMRGSTASFEVQAREPTVMEREVQGWGRGERSRERQERSRVTSKVGGRHFTRQRRREWSRLPDVPRVCLCATGAVARSLLGPAERRVSAQKVATCCLWRWPAAARVMPTRSATARPARWRARPDQWSAASFG